MWVNKLEKKETRGGGESSARNKRKIKRTYFPVAITNLAAYRCARCIAARSPVQESRTNDRRCGRGQHFTGRSRRQGTTVLSDLVDTGMTFATIPLITGTRATGFGCSIGKFPLRPAHGALRGFSSLSPFGQGVLPPRVTSRFPRSPVAPFSRSIPLSCRAKIPKTYTHNRVTPLDNRHFRPRTTYRTRIPLNVVSVAQFGDIDEKVYTHGGLPTIRQISDRSTIGLTKTPYQWSFTRKHIFT